MVSTGENNAGRWTYLGQGDQPAVWAPSATASGQTCGAATVRPFIEGEEQATKPVGRKRKRPPFGFQ